MSVPNKSLRSALGKVRGKGSAKSGVAAWLDLRMMALVLIPLTLYALIGFLNNAVSGGYSGAVYWLQSPVSATFTILMLLAGFKHGAAGLKEIIEDYVHTEFSKLALIFAVNFVAAALAILGTLSVAKIFFGV
jgi:succinate dehydrogenase / fumarate reductase membrane anchor subunit